MNEYCFDKISKLIQYYEKQKLLSLHKVQHNITKYNISNHYCWVYNQIATFIQLTIFCLCKIKGKVNKYDDFSVANFKCQSIEINKMR